MGERFSSRPRERHPASLPLPVRPFHPLFDRTGNVLRLRGRSWHPQGATMPHVLGLPHAPVGPATVSRGLAGPMGVATEAGKTCSCRADGVCGLLAAGQHFHQDIRGHIRMPAALRTRPATDSLLLRRACNSAGTPAGLCCGPRRGEFSRGNWMAARHIARLTPGGEASAGCLHPFQ